jgi:hypothetical protein
VRASRNFLWLRLGCAALALGSCVFDPNARCDEHMEDYGDAIKCVCVPGYAMTEGGCIKCRANESPGVDGCECDEGFVRSGAGRCERAPAEDAACAMDTNCDDVEPPTGVGLECTSDADCAGTDATYCETLVSHACVVQGCSVEENDCFEGNECCDLSAFGMPTLCVLEGRCP